MHVWGYQFTQLNHPMMLSAAQEFCYQKIVCRYRPSTWTRTMNQNKLVVTLTSLCCCAGRGGKPTQSKYSQKVKHSKTNFERLDGLFCCKEPCSTHCLVFFLVFNLMCRQRTIRASTLLLCIPPHQLPPCMERCHLIVLEVLCGVFEIHSS